MPRMTEPGVTGRSPRVVRSRGSGLKATYDGSHGPHMWPSAPNIFFTNQGLPLVTPGFVINGLQP